jgi:hypothetical protein
MKYALPVLAALLLASTAATVADAAQQPAGPQIQRAVMAPLQAQAAQRAKVSADVPATLVTNYEMSLNFQPDVTDWLNRSDIGACTPGDGGSFVCTLNGSWTDLGAPLTGTVRDPATGVTGALRASCSIAGYSYVAFSISPATDSAQLPLVDLVGAGGNVQLDCAWRMRMNDSTGSLLVGRAHANSALTAADPASALVRLSDNINFDVAAGTGVFKGLTGTGFTTAAVTFPMLGPGGELPIDFQLVSLSGSRSGSGSGARAANSAQVAAAVTSQNTGNIAFRLYGAPPNLRLSAPQRTGRRTLGRALVGETVPGSQCRFSARSGGRSAALGSARADLNGIVRLPRAKASSLSAGKWRITGECKMGAGVARDTASVTLTR